jgi:hypothetical protein
MWTFTFKCDLKFRIELNRIVYMIATNNLSMLKWFSVLTSVDTIWNWNEWNCTSLNIFQVIRLDISQVIRLCLFLRVETEPNETRMQVKCKLNINDKESKDRVVGDLQSNCPWFWLGWAEEEHRSIQTCDEHRRSSDQYWLGKNRGGAVIVTDSRENGCSRNLAWANYAVLAPLGTRRGHAGLWRQNERKRQNVRTIGGRSERAWIQPKNTGSWISWDVTSFRASLLDVIILFRL